MVVPPMLQSFCCRYQPFKRKCNKKYFRLCRGYLISFSAKWGNIIDTTYPGYREMERMLTDKICVYLICGKNP